MTDETRANKKARTGVEQTAAVSTSTEEQERIRLRKEPRQHLWEREAQGMPLQAPTVPKVVPPCEDPTKHPYIPALDPAVTSQPGQPTYRQMNPHFRLNRQGPMPPQPLPPHRPFPEGPFEVPPIMASEFKGNVSLEMLADLQELMTSENPPTILAIIPHGAGKLMAANELQIITDIQDFLYSLAFEENDRMPYEALVYGPDLRNTPGEKSQPFSKPWTFFLELPRNADPLRRFLLWQRVFAVSKTVSFTVYELENDDRYWDIYPIRGTSILKDPTHAKVLAQKDLILSAIKRDLSADRDFRICASELAFRNLRHTGDLTKAIETLCSTFHLERTELEDGYKDGELAPAYVLLARPPVANDPDYAAWRALFDRHPVYRIALQRFSVAVGTCRVFCELCKSRIHCTARCPWPDVEGWLGITPRDLGVRASNGTPTEYYGPPGNVRTGPLFTNFTKACQEKAAVAAATKAALNQKGGTNRQAHYSPPKATGAGSRKGKGKGRAN
ncbi:hypothetical protein PYCCODRAFT_1444586 [Trametes coccinea BRFM310]|uniref:Uncharacterized protein n=1 Tax=Trametes coccinea (strain BRFM310) TaxID=1353009 RepID=A0A1Y2IQ05_TRAC3|nr:hypothetical protein PYCCODRAFT_1444586 [Trametes coccinea BRFM310]